MVPNVKKALVSLVNFLGRNREYLAKRGLSPEWWWTYMSDTARGIHQ